jgi:hypothetical protein
MDWLYLFTYIELRSGPKVHWQHEFHVDQVWWEGLSPQNQWIPLFLIELGILGMSNCTYQIISTYHNCQSWKIRRWVSPGGLRERQSSVGVLETLHSRTTSRHIYVADPSGGFSILSQRHPEDLPTRFQINRCVKWLYRLHLRNVRNIQGSCNRLVYFAQKSVLKTLVHLTSKSKVAFRPSETWRTSIIASIWPISILVTMSSIRNVWLVN